MEKPNYYELLDNWLDIIYNADRNLNDVSKEDLHNHLLRNMISVSPYTEEEMCLKLIRDGYVKQLHPGKYKLTFEGLVFIQDGKYRQENWRLFVKEIWTIMNIGLVSVAAIITTWYYFSELTKPEQKPEQEHCIQSVQPK